MGGFYFLVTDDVGIIDLIYQLVLGREINGVFWYLSIQIITTIFLYFINHLPLKRKLIDILMIVLLIICFVLQYSKINYNLFVNTVSQVNGSIGRGVEILPYAISGMFLYKHKEALNRLKHVPVFCLIFICIILYIKLPNCLGMGYQGITLFVVALLIFVMFYSLRIKENRLLKILSTYTFGVYCVHMYIGKLLVSLGVIKNYLILCLVVYILSLFCCIAILKLAVKR